MSANKESKHLQVASWMREQIVSGQWKPGDRLPSYNETRALHGVHTATMEKVYARLESEGLIERRRGSGTYVLEQTPRQSTSTGILGLSGAGFNFSDYSPYWANLQGGVRDAVTKAGMQLLILDPTYQTGWEKADGVLVCDWSDPRVPRKTVPGMPVVSLMMPTKSMASVVADDEGGARQATEFLLSKGHRRIGFLHAYEQIIVFNRMIGYQDALKTEGVHPNPKWTRLMRGRYDTGLRYTTEARKNMLLWLRDGWEKLGCTALICHNDEAATGVIHALNEAGIRVPQDVSVVGFDGTEYCELVSPRISSVEIPLRSIGAAAVNLLLEQINGNTVSQSHLVIGTKFVERDTTAAPSK